MQWHFRMKKIILLDYYYNLRFHRDNKIIIILKWRNK